MSKFPSQRLLLVLLILVLTVPVLLGGCGTTQPQPNSLPAEHAPLIVTDMAGRQVAIPEHLERITAFKHLGTLVFALGQQDKLVNQGLLNATAKAMAAVDPDFAALPYFKDVSAEELLALGTQLVFAFHDTDPNEIQQLTDLGIAVVLLKGETLEEAYEAVRIMGQALQCEDKAEEYIAACQGIVNRIQDRLKDIPEQDRPRVFYAGPKSIYTAASGDMLQNTMIQLAGGVNVAAETIGHWAQISPEQLIKWNPEVIFLGSTTGEYASEDVFSNEALQSVTAVQRGAVYLVPSNIGWWDYPAPHCVLGIQYMASQLYPDRFQDIDLTQLADDFYQRFTGRSFTELGGQL